MAVTKVIELIGNSTESWEDAARSALAAAGTVSYTHLTLPTN